MQGLTKVGGIFCLKICRPGVRRERERSRSLMVRKQSFVWAYLEGDSHLKWHSHDFYPGARECHFDRRRI